MYDPYPGQALLTLGEVAKLLACDARTLRRVRAEDATFPKPIQLGKPAKGTARLRFRKVDVLVWLLSRQPAEEK